MGTVIKFRRFISNTGDASNYFEAAYRHVGLNEKQIEFSLGLIEPLIKEIFDQNSFVVSIPTNLGFNSKQNDYISNLASSFKNKEWKMLCDTANIVAVTVGANPYLK